MQQAALTKFLWSIKKLCAVYFSVYKSQRDLYVENDKNFIRFKIKIFVHFSVYKKYVENNNEYVNTNCTLTY